MASYDIAVHKTVVESYGTVIGNGIEALDAAKQTAIRTAREFPGHQVHVTLGGKSIGHARKPPGFEPYWIDFQNA